MKIKKNQISFILFNFSIIFIFIFSYFYPEKTFLSNEVMVGIIIYEMFYIVALSLLKEFYEIKINFFILFWGVLYFLFITIAEFINFNFIHNYGVKKY